MSEVLTYEGDPLVVDGEPTMDPLCCCNHDCCLDWKGVRLLVEIEWRCPVNGDNGPLFFYEWVDWVEDHQRWEGWFTLGCSIPDNFPVAIICGASPIRPMEGGGPWWLNFDNDSRWVSNLATTCDRNLFIEWQTPVTGPISDGGCCSLSPGGIAFVRVRGAR